jgi:hypothetical protein
MLGIAVIWRAVIEKVLDHLTKADRTAVAFCGRRSH